MPMPSLSRRHLLAASGASAAVGALPAGAVTIAPEPDFKGRSVLVTGASSGFGRLTALRFARLGAKVFATMRNLPRPEANELLRIAAAEKLDLAVLPLDVLSEDQVNAAVAEAESRSGGALDVVVNNAGIVISGPVEVHDIEAARLAFETNVFGVHRVLRAALPAMRARKAGLVVNVSSQQGRVVMPGFGLYAPTKFALEALSEQLAYELAPHGIDVAIVQPGGFPTSVGANRARYNASLRSRIPSRHADGYPELVAQMVPAPREASAPSETPPAGMPDPADVARAIAEIAALPAGRRPLRRAVHPGLKPQLEINRVSAETRLTWLGSGAFGPWVRAVHD